MMRTGKFLQGIVWSLASIAVALPVVQAQEPAALTTSVSFGTIVGVVTNTAKVPVGGATVTAVRAGGGIRATVSGSDGVYSFADLPPGVWSLTVEVDGYPEASVPSLQVVASKATRRDVVMNVPAAASAPTPSVAALAPTAPSTSTPPPSAPAIAERAPIIAEALQAPAPAPQVDLQTPFAVGDLGWMNGTPREKSPIFDTKFFTPEVRFDMNYLQSGNHPIDHTIVGSTEEFRSGEFQIEQVSFGGDFHWEGVRARFLSMFGMFATTTPRNDASSSVGQWTSMMPTGIFRRRTPGITST